MLDIQNLRSRGETLLKNGFYTSALEMYQQADAIALPFSDLPEMQQQHQELTEKIAQCQQKKSR